MRTTLSLPLVGLIFIGLTIGVAFFQYTMFQSYGGAYVAESVGARYVSPATANPKERILLNIVEEVAIASSLPVPPVFIIPASQINAFAAGLKPENAAIAITEGALNILTRDEIEGVIAHEFGHIYNGDMKISLRLAAMVMGFYFAFWMGLRVLQFSSFSRSSRDDKKNGNVVALAGVILLGAGLITWLAGAILQAMVSRQREYLADACSVQFTRNPNCIVEALKKIEKESRSDMPKEGMAFAHLYFNDRSFFSSIFATHPPLEDRISAIEGKPTSPMSGKKIFSPPLINLNTNYLLS